MLYYGIIVINVNVWLGKYCCLYVCVNIGVFGGGKVVFRLGNFVYVGFGVKIYGDIEIVDWIVIVVNVVVYKFFLCFD